MEIIQGQTIILGPPGTGKTTTLMDLIEEDLEAHEPEHIALVSFTKKAVGEAIDRVTQRFPQYEKARFPHFQTIHAMCYRQLGCQKSDLMTRQDYTELGEITGYSLNASISMEDGALILPDADKGAKLLFLDNYARTTRRPLKDIWKDASSDIMWGEVERFSNAYSEYKRRTGKLDFTDLLDRYIAIGKPAAVSCAYIDEAQDLSRIQWEVLQKFFSNVDQLYIAGDDDQSIFKWSGADLNAFLELTGEKQVLAHSYRLPVAVYNKAAAIVSRVKHRFSKAFTPSEAQGKVSYISSLDHVKIDTDESTLILVRNVYLLKNVYEFLRLKGLNFTGRNGYEAVETDHIRAISSWEMLRKGDTIPLENVKLIYEYLRVGDHLARGGKAELTRIDRSDEFFTWETLRDHYGLKHMPIWHKALIGIPLEKREYYIGMLRRKQKLSGEAKVHVNTIHGVKGGEADHVIVLSDMSRKTYEEMIRDPCSEHRCAYVAVTRSKNKLTIVLPQGKYSYVY